MRILIENRFQKFLSECGIDLISILRDAKIPNAINQEILKLNEKQYFDLQESLSKKLTNKQLLAISDIKNIELFMPIFLVSLSASNGLDALEKFASYKQVISPIKVDILKLKDDVQIKLSIESSNYNMPFFSVVNELGVLLTMIRTGSGIDIKPFKISTPFNFDKEILDFFKAPFEYSNEVIMSLKYDDLLIPFFHSNNLMLKMIQEDLDFQLSKIKSEKKFLRNVRAKLQEMIISREYSIQELAKKMQTSARTLQREFKNNDTTFSNELQIVRMQMSIIFWKKEMDSIDEISYLMGYSEPSVFHKAFKKWTGFSFSEYMHKKMINIK